MLCIRRTSSALAGGEDRLSQGAGKVNLGWPIENLCATPTDEPRLNQMNIDFIYVQKRSF